MSCKKTVYPSTQWGYFRGHACKKPEWKDGYCKVHHPDSVAERNKLSQEKWDLKWSNSPEMRLKRALEEITTLKLRIKELEGE